jgi:hypothetical protein
MGARKNHVATTTTTSIKKHFHKANKNGNGKFAQHDDLRM